jgi:monoamine oxidase
MSTQRHMFASVAPGRPSVRAAYETWLEANSPGDAAGVSADAPPLDPRQLEVGIVGAGMAGLYAALLLQSVGAAVHVFEADPTRLGGRVYTHRFAEQDNQYFEAGAMRLPHIPEQQPVFDLIDWLDERVAPDRRVETIPYVLYDDSGNRVFVNGRRRPDGGVMSVDYANAHPEELGFPLAPADQRKTASELLDEELGPFLKLLEDDFERGFREIVAYDNFSLHAYLAQVAGWSEDKINYVETMTSQTNQFQHSFTELLIENMDFSTAGWRTIVHGMDRLPSACGDVIGAQNITFGAAVHQLEQLPDGRVAIHHVAASEPAVFDRVIAAVPPAALRMCQTPRWSPTKEHAVRALHFEPLYKIGMRFRTRFWEQVANPSRGGQSITDLPSRWFVYPSYGIGDDGPGVLLLYAWMTDAAGWSPQSEDDRVRLALRDLDAVYGGEVDVHDLFIEAFDVAWASEWATGDAMFFPGQFRQLFNAARLPEGSIYFAGEHLSVHHTWIVGALDSALLACQQLLADPRLAPLTPRGAGPRRPHTYDYRGCADAVALALPGGPPPGTPADVAPRRWQFAHGK